MYTQKLYLLFLFLAIIYKNNLFAMKISSKDFVCSDCIRALAYVEAQNWDSAKFYFKKMRKTSYAHLYLSIVYWKQKKPKKERAYWQLAVKKNGYYALYRLGRILEKMGEIDKAKLYFELAAFHEVLRAENRLGVIAYKEQNFNLALYHFRIAADQGYSYAHYNLATWYENNNLPTQAQKWYNAALNMELGN